MNKAYRQSIFDPQDPPTEERPRGIKRLNLSTGARRNRNVTWPSFDPRALTPGILHLGCGAFHRAHQNIYTQRAIELEGKSGNDWGVVGVCFRSDTTKQLLASQDFLYTVLEQSQDTTTAEVVGVLKGVLFARDQRAKIIAAFTAPQTRIVTLTVTASGYSAIPIGLGDGSPPPIDAIGLIVDGLAAVRAQGISPPVLMSCDNIIGNGRHLREALVQRAIRQSNSLSEWIADNVQCPSSVGDRIVPIPMPSDCENASALLGLQDLATVATEPFRQWVIEDFDGARPRWDLAGARFVSDVSPWEASKLSLLNGTHMAIAYLGILSGLTTVSEFIRDPLFAKYASRLMLDEQAPNIPRCDHDLVSYANQLLDRWRNEKMMHQLHRIGRNGSEKLESRLLASLAKNMAAGRSSPCTMLAIAAWICCAGRIMTYNGVIEDNASSALEMLAARSQGNTRELLRSLLCWQNIFGSELPHISAFREELAEAVDLLKLHGPRGAASRVLSQSADIYS